MKTLKPKRRGVDLEVRTFIGKSGRTYLVYRTQGGSYHVFAETEAKEAARDCGGTGRNTRQYWASVW